MSDFNMAEMRNIFADKKPTTQTSNNFQSNYYPFWFMDVGAQAVIRFLPDLNDENPRGFLVEKRMHELTINGKPRKVPCNYMYGDKCPICDASRDFYAAEGDNSPNGKKYWRKRSFVGQALIKENPIKVSATGEKGSVEEDPQGTVKLVSITQTLYKKIQNAFASDDMEVPPFMFEGGTDFIIKKDQQGKYADYVLSDFSRKSTDVDSATIEAIGDQMVDLSTTIPKQRTYEELQALLEADLTGSHYDDPKKVDNIPSTVEAATTETATVTETATAESTTTEATVEASEPVQAEASASTDGELSPQEKAAKVMEQIKARRNA